MPSLNLPPAIIEALDALPVTLTSRSGSVFYSGSTAFTAPSSLYVLGLNPGGSPVAQAGETLRAHLDVFREREAPWSAYADEAWAGRPAGTWGMQPRVLHLFAALGLDPRMVPSSNVVFVRSATEADLEREKGTLLAQCWPVHQAAIEALQVRVLLCFGGTAGRWARERLGATVQVDEYRETNRRGWVSTAHQVPDGRTVITTTHPSRADWRNPEADPSPLVRRVLGSGN
jgi:hypothetical protein